MDLLERCLIFPALVLVAWLAGIVFAGEMIPGSLRRFSPGVLLGSGSLGLFCLFALLFHDYTTYHFVSVGIVCLLTGLLYAIPAGLLSWLLLRRGFALNFVSAGLAAGTLGGWLASLCWNCIARISRPHTSWCGTPRSCH